MVQENILMENIIYYIKRFVNEFLEAFIIIILYKLITKEDYYTNIFDVIKKSLIIAPITLFLEEYDREYKKAIKSGMLTIAGSGIIKK